MTWTNAKQWVLNFLENWSTCGPGAEFRETSERQDALSNTVKIVWLKIAAPWNRRPCSAEHLEHVKGRPCSTWSRGIYGEEYYSKKFKAMVCFTSTYSSPSTNWWGRTPKSARHTRDKSSCCWAELIAASAFWATSVSLVGIASMKCKAKHLKFIARNYGSRPILNS